MASPSPRSSRLGSPSIVRSGTVYIISSDGQVLHLPIPSTSPHDPLNWSSRKRALAFLAIGLYSAVGLALPQAAGLSIHGLQLEFGSTIPEPFGIDSLLSAPTLCMGIGALLWIPMTVWLGRRPVFVMASIIMLLAVVLAAFATNYFMLFAAVCLLGLAEGFSLSAALLIIIDLTFIHQRPNAIAMVWGLTGLAGTSSLVVSPFITNDGVDWRGYYRYAIILATAVCITVILFFPETYFKRPPIAFDGRLVVQSGEESLMIYDEPKQEIMDGLLPGNPRRSPVVKLSERFSFLRAGPGRFKAMGRCYAQVLFCAINPMIFWVALLNAIAFGAMMFIGETFARVLSEPPYRLPGHYITLVNVASGVGGLIAWPVQGPLMTRLLRSLSLRNKGVREAEHYLIMFILPVLAGATSAGLYGIAVQQKWHFAFVYICYGLNGFNFAGQAIANTLWVTEAFPLWAAPALVVVGGGSYMLSFSLSFVLVPWIEKQGMLKVGVELAALQLALGLVVVPLEFWGRGARQYLNNRWGKARDGALRPQ